MASQVHFLGLDISHEEVRTSLLRRDGALVAALRRPMPAAREEGDRCAVSPLRWAREAGYAARELIEASGVPTSRIWGYAPAAPPGWICLDVEWNPMGELYLAKEGLVGRIAQEVARFLDETEGGRSRVGAILAPKDFLRFHWNKVIATDASDAASLGLLARDALNWNAAALSRTGLRHEWLPPILPSAFACGLVGPGGTEALGLQSSSWAAVGGNCVTARLAACGLLPRPAVYLLASEPARGHWYAEGTAGAAGDRVPASSPLDDLPPRVFTEETPVILDWLEGEDPEPILAWAHASGRPAFRAPFAGAISPGASVLAALASGAYASRESFYRRFARPQALK